MSAKTENKSENNFDMLLQGIANLDEQQKEALFEALLPPESSDDNETIENKKEIITEDLQTKNTFKKESEQQTDNNLKSKENEDV